MDVSSSTHYTSSSYLLIHSWFWLLLWSRKTCRKNQSDKGQLPFFSRCAVFSIAAFLENIHCTVDFPTLFAIFTVADECDTHLTTWLQTTRTFASCLMWNVLLVSIFFCFFKPKTAHLFCPYTQCRPLFIVPTILRLGVFKISQIYEEQLSTILIIYWALFGFSFINSTRKKLYSKLNQKTKLSAPLLFQFLQNSLCLLTREQGMVMEIIKISAAYFPLTATTGFHDRLGAKYTVLWKFLFLLTQLRMEDSFSNCYNGRVNAEHESFT